ncbi:Derlin (Degradation in endoplasmic reticulum protein) (Der1-like protein) [Ectocarpus siliculosus]|uniref:Derlin n=1 Tax=Ectocarpus siliculosus TaxID=2880 RepID=D7G2R6_ECTSI|nr:Derlin (Degradation in endoplasmic reticulum protein) (Der1-like protein) [Ectocarpus siliculosus]|eukprot:CBJ26891.1 Derlin (Degradation in endoplasmic reticulum protein) (Der1-like protein) [Ectocarpus siliculosus]
MVLRHPACLGSVVLLALGLTPTAGRVSPRLLALGSSFSGRHENGKQRQQPEQESLQQRAAALRLGGDRQSFLAHSGNGRKGAWGLTVASGLRGGADDEDSDDEDYDDDEEEEEDFGEASFVDRLKQDWKKTPVITRAYFQVSVAITLAAAALNENQWPTFLLLDWRPAIFKLQLWRLFTPFLNLGPLGLNFALTAHFAWTYMSHLEKLHYREPHTFVMLLAFGMSSLLLLTLVTGGDVNSSYTLGHSMNCFLVMIWSRKFAGTRVNMLDMFELPTELLPYFFVAQTLMMEGVIPWVDLSGILIGYAWQTLSLKGLLKAPKPLVNLFRNNAFLRAEYAKAGKEYGQDVPLHDDDDDHEEDDDSDATLDEASEGSKKGEAAGRTGKGAAGKRAAAATDRQASSDAARKAARGEGAGKAAEPVPDEEVSDDSGTKESQAAEGGRGGEYVSGEESEELADVKEFDEEAESMLEEFEGDLDTAQDFSDSSEEEDSDSDDF